MVHDPATGQELPESAIQRVVLATPNVHIYSILPLTSNRGFSAASWTSPPPGSSKPTAQQIFTARIRVIETSVESSIKADIVLEDGNSGELFAAAPYTSAAVVQQANDSSRFFAVRVQGEGGVKATLGIGFEERGAALDFNICLAECRKVLGWEGGAQSGLGKSDGLEGETKQDFSLKEGQKIHIQVGSRGKRSSAPTSSATGQDDGAALFSIAPPPLAAAKTQSGVSAIAPPPAVENKTAQELGFDDGEFGEFQ